MSSFGRQILGTTDAAGLLRLEASEARGDFDALDRLTERALVTRLRGHDIATGEVSRDEIRFTELDADERAVIEARYDLASIEQLGTWAMPPRLSVSTQLLSVDPWADGTKGRDAKGNPDLVFAWSILDPLYRLLLRPVSVRKDLTVRPREKQDAIWQDIDKDYAALGIDLEAQLRRMRPGAGWMKLNVTERQAIYDEIGRAVLAYTPVIASSYRAARLRRLVKVYYDRADSEGRALRTRVVGSALLPTFVAYFGGDWLAFLAYIGELPHAGEQIVGSLPEVKLTVAGGDKISAVAAVLGLPPEEAVKISAALWGATKSPIEDRVDALSLYWNLFDDVHARQRSGMPALWGLVESETDVTNQWDGGRGPTSGLFRSLLPQTTLDDIERLWGTVMSSRQPVRLVTSVSPHALTAEAFGPALDFWHGVALTAWYLCEGPYSRTDIDGMPEYYGKNIDDLAALGTPVDQRLFEDLKEAARKLHVRKRKPEHESTVDVGPGISVTLSMSLGDQFEGFEHLRDVISEHRRRWASEFLGHYLRARWHRQVIGAGETYQRLSATTNKPPTIKKFANASVKNVVNQWFGGDISKLYGSIGERCPEPVSRWARLVPNDRYAFVRVLLGELTPLLRPHLSRRSESDESVQRHLSERDKDWELYRVLAQLAEFAFQYLQAREVAGDGVTIKDTGEAAFRRARTVRVEGENRMLFGTDEEAWAFLTGVINRAAASTPASAPRELAAPPSITPPQPSVGASPPPRSMTAAPQSAASKIARLFRRN